MGASSEKEKKEKTGKAKNQKSDRTSDIVATAGGVLA